MDSRGNDIAFRAARGPLSARIRPLVSVDDLAASGKPDALVFFDLGQGALQILDAQRLAGDHRMQRNAHDPRLLLAVGVECLELVDHRPAILLGGVALSDKERDVVDLHVIRGPYKFPALDLHSVMLTLLS